MKQTVSLIGNDVLPEEQAAGPYRLQGCLSTSPSPRRRVILALVESYLPGYKGGGPVRSIANLVEALGDEFDFLIVTSDRDVNQQTPYEGIEPNCWLPVGKAQVMYIPVGPWSLFKFIETLRSVPCDVLYLNSFFSRRYSMLPALLQRLGLLRTSGVILAPRGEFSPGALQFKAWRKRAYIRLSRTVRIYQDVVWCASSEYEEGNIRSAFRETESISVAPPFSDPKPAPKGALKIEIALDIPEGLPAEPVQKTAFRNKPAGSIRLVFVSRISPMKNLEGALTLLSDLSGQVRFTIYGPVEDRACWRRCQEIISTLPPNICVEYAGAVPHHVIHNVLSQNDVFFLPTHGENFGHVILEALLAGCPVVISDQTPWRNLESRGVGWDLPLQHPERFRDVLQSCIDMDPEAFADFSRRAGEFGTQKSTDVDVLHQNLALFKFVLPKDSIEPVANL